VRRYTRKSVEIGIYQRGWVTEHKFQTEGGVAHQSLLVSEQLE